MVGVVEVSGQPSHLDFARGSRDDRVHLTFDLGGEFGGIGAGCRRRPDEPCHASATAGASVG